MLGQAAGSCERCPRPCSRVFARRREDAELSLHEHTVGKWRRRFLKDRCDGLLDEVRPGRPRTINDDQVAAVIERTLRTTPADATHWSIRSMAAETGLSQPRTVEPAASPAVSAIPPHVAAGRDPSPGLSRVVFSVQHLFCFNRGNAIWDSHSDRLGATFVIDRSSKQSILEQPARPPERE
jgi:Homeodomain-like domain